MSQEKKTGTSRDLPQDVLDVAHRVWLAGLGALASAQEGGDRVFQQLVDRGREMEGSGRETVRESVRGAEKRVRSTADNVRESARSAAEGVGDALDSRIGSVLHRLGVPTRDEIKDLTHRVEELNRKIERVRSTKPATAPAPVPPVRPTAKTGAAPKGATPRPATTGGSKAAGAGKPGPANPVGGKPAGGAGGGPGVGKASGKPAGKPTGGKGGA